MPADPRKTTKPTLEQKAAALLAAAARRSMEGTVRAGMLAYDRDRHLPALIRVDPTHEPADDEAALRLIVARLERALRAERNRARAGHWTYDLNRHIALKQAHAAERVRLEELERAARRDAPPAEPKL